MPALSLISAGVDGVKARAVDFQINKFKEEAKKLKEDQESSIREKEIMQRMLQIQVQSFQM